MSGFNLEDYVQVNERIEKFYAKYPEGSLQAEVLELNESRVVMRAYAYRNPDDPRPGIGHSMLTIPGKTPYTKDSEVENAETSAVGRAIAMLGFEVKKSIASRNEIESKGATVPRENGHLIGTGVKEKRITTDFLVRESPDGPFLGFRIKDGLGSVICEVRGPLAVVVAAHEAEIVGQRIQVWGSFHQYEPPAVKHPYRAFRVTRMQGTFGTIPVPEGGPGQPPEAGAEAAGVTESAPDEAVAVPAAPDAAGASSPEPAALSPGSEPQPVGLAVELQCDSASPYGDNLQCELLDSHRGPHKVLSTPFPETWTDR